jgi:hypothetical protein
MPAAARRQKGTGRRRSHEWATYLRQLLDPTVWAEMGGKAHALAAEHTVKSTFTSGSSTMRTLILAGTV